MAISREEMLMQSIATGEPSNNSPVTREEKYLSYIAGESASKPAMPITRKEVFLDKISPSGGSSGGSSGGVTIRNQNKTITENGTYTADSGYTGLGTVTVEVASAGGGGDIDALIGRSITEVNSGVTSVGDSVFHGCSMLTSANLPNATSVGTNAFRMCTSLISANLPKASNISTYMFYGCAALKSVSFPDARNIYDSSFQNCTALTSVDFPNAIEIFPTVFSGCYKLASVNFPYVKTIGQAAFYNCEKLEKAIFPSVTIIGAQGFYYCKELVIADFPQLKKINNSNVFTGCRSLRAFILRSETLVSLSGSSVFTNCNRILGNYDETYNPDYKQDGYFYVPRALVENYKAATNWAAYASQFRALEDYTVDGTITGALDPNKI